VHARPLEPGSDHHFATSLDHAGRSAKTLFVELWISHAPSIFPNVRNTLPHLFVLSGVATNACTKDFK
jgi:hypothetical protein